MATETRARSLVKTIIWRVVATLITGSTIYFFTQEWSESVEITFVAALLSMTGYYIHERVWNRIHWGEKN